jgi:hypothetical protein
MALPGPDTQALVPERAPAEHDLPLLAYLVRTAGILGQEHPDNPDALAPLTDYLGIRDVHDANGAGTVCT